MFDDELHVVTYSVTDVTDDTMDRPSSLALLWDLFGLPLLPSSLRRSFVKRFIEEKV